jgi:hypothetical protein
MWQLGSDGESVVSGRAATEVWESVTSTAGSRLACHPGTFERESEVAVEVHGSWVYRQGVQSRVDTAGHGGQLQGSATGAVGRDTGQAAHAMVSAMVLHPYCGSLQILKESAVPAVEVHTEVSFALMGTLRKKEGHRLRWAEEDEEKSESWTAASVRLAMSFAKVWPLPQRWLCLLSMRDP